MQSLERACVVIVAVLAVLFFADLAGARFLDARREPYRRELADLQRMSSAYRRGVTGGAVDGNAAPWYGLALERMTRANHIALGPVVRGGPGRYRELVSPPVFDACRESTGSRVAAAMQSTRCDWELSFAFARLNPFEYTREAVSLGSCLAIDGYRAAAAGDDQAALQAYLRGVAFGCDLGNGDALMTMAGIVSAGSGLKGLGRLAMRTDNLPFLEGAATELAVFATCLPTAKSQLSRERLWLENAIAEDALALEGGRFSPRGGLYPDRAIQAWHLWRETGLLRAFGALVDIDDHDRAMTAGEQIKDQAKRSRNPVIRATDIGTDALLKPSALELTNLFRASEMVIRLQQWHAKNGTYPTDAKELGLPLNEYGLRYEAAQGGGGYTVSGYQGNLFERVPTK